MSVPDKREQGFSTYFQGANRDGNINTTATSASRSSSAIRKRNKGWGEPTATILGRKIIPDKQGAEDDSNDNGNNSSRININDDDMTSNNYVRDDDADQDKDVESELKMEFSSMFNIRMRISSTWTKSKYLTLKRMQLFLIQSYTPCSASSSTAKQVHRTKLNMLNREHIQITLINELIMLPPSHDAVKSSYKLFCTEKEQSSYLASNNHLLLENSFNNRKSISSSGSSSSSLNSLSWVCPMPSHIGSAAELNVSGDLSFMLTQELQQAVDDIILQQQHVNIEDKRSNQATVELKLEILIWNETLPADANTTSQTPSRGGGQNTASPVKDFSIFVNSKCICSQELKPGNGYSSSSSGSLSARDDEEEDEANASLRLLVDLCTYPPNAAAAANTTSTANMNAMNSSNHTSSSSSKNYIKQQQQQSPTKPSFATPRKDDDDNDGGSSSSSSEPNWLLGLRRESKSNLLSVSKHGIASEMLGDSVAVTSSGAGEGRDDMMSAMVSGMKNILTKQGSGVGSSGSGSEGVTHSPGRRISRELSASAIYALANAHAQTTSSSGSGSTSPVGVNRATATSSIEGDTSYDVSNMVAGADRPLSRSRRTRETTPSPTPTKHTAGETASEASPSSAANEKSIDVTDSATEEKSTSSRTANKNNPFRRRPLAGSTDSNNSQSTSTSNETVLLKSAFQGPSIDNNKLQVSLDALSSSSRLARGRLGNSASVLPNLPTHSADDSDTRATAPSAAAAATGAVSARGRMTEKYNTGVTAVPTSDEGDKVSYLSLYQANKPDQASLRELIQQPPAAAAVCRSQSVPTATMDVDFSTMDQDVDNNNDQKIRVNGPSNEQLHFPSMTPEEVEQERTKRRQDRSDKISQVNNTLAMLNDVITTTRQVSHAKLPSALPSSSSSPSASKKTLGTGDDHAASAVGGGDRGGGGGVNVHGIAAAASAAVNSARVHQSLSSSSAVSRVVQCARVMPRGRVLRFVVYSTWGDEFYTGLNGLEIFNHKGELLVKDKHIEGVTLLLPSLATSSSSTASVSLVPVNANILHSEVSLDTNNNTYHQQAQEDPRRLVNVIDGVNFTRDDLHVWLAAIESPVTSTGASATADSSPLIGFDITLKAATQLSMLRVFNYNKSRTHSTRGVRKCKILFDDKLVLFDSQLRRGPGQVTSLDAVAQDLRFTDDEHILATIDEFDHNSGYHSLDIDELEESMSASAGHTASLGAAEAAARPTTSESRPAEDGAAAVVASAKMSNTLSATSVLTSQLMRSSNSNAMLLRGSPSSSVLKPIVESESETITPLMTPSNSDTKASSSSSTVAENLSGSGTLDGFRKQSLSNSIGSRINKFITATPTVTVTESASAPAATAMEGNQSHASPSNSTAVDDREAEPEQPTDSSEPELLSADDLLAQLEEFTSTRLSKSTTLKSAFNTTSINSNASTAIFNAEIHQNLEFDETRGSAISSATTVLAGNGNGNGANYRANSFNSTLMASGPMASEYSATAPFSAFNSSSGGKYINTVTNSSGHSSARSNPYFLLSEHLIHMKTLRLEVLSTWGDDTYVGLTGLDLLSGVECARVEGLTSTHLTTEPTDLSALGFFDDPRKPINLLDGINNTTDEKHMWLAPYTPGSMHEIVIALDASQQQRVNPISGFRVWNYNKRGKFGDEVLRGIRLVKVYVNSELLGLWELRMAPGYDGLDISQTVLFRDILDPFSTRPSSTVTATSASRTAAPAAVLNCPGRISLENYSVLKSLSSDVTKKDLITNAYLRQDYEVQCWPSASLYTFVFHENLNDMYYIGLDGIEFYDYIGNRIDVLSCGGKVLALPHSLNVLSAQQSTTGTGGIAGSSGSAGKDMQTMSDPRTPRKLFRTRTVSKSNQDTSLHSWLAPLSRCVTEEERLRAGHTQPHSFDSQQSPVASSSNPNPRFPVDNTLFIMFPYPITLGYIRIFNYSKSLLRGVKMFSLYADDKLVYMGSLKSAECETTEQGRAGQIIALTKDVNLLRPIGKYMNYCGISEQDVLCINEKQVIVRSKSMFEPPNASSEGIFSDLQKRPSTSFFMHS